MPIIAAAVFAYAAGLLAGFGDAGSSVTWLVAAAYVVARVRRQRDRIAIAAISVAGLASAVTAERARRACTDRVLTGTPFEATLDADAAPGSFVPATVRCGSRVRLAIAVGDGRAGAGVVVRGTPLRSRDLVILTAAQIAPRAPPSLLATWRAAIGRGIDARFGADAPLVRALLVADMRSLPPSLRDRFAAAGMSHMLSVSGLHVGLIAIAVALLAQSLGLPRTRAELSVVAVVTLYVAVIGAPLPAVRSAAMLGAYSMSRVTQRPTSAWAVLALGAALPLADPLAVLDLGYQLSVVGMVALIASGALSRRWSRLRTRGWRGELMRGVVASIMATLLTGPLVAATFGRVSLIAPISNLVAVPLIAVLQPMLFLAALLLPVPALAQFVADASHPLLVAVDAVASFAAAVPGASISVTIDPISTVLASGAGVALAVAAVSRFPGRALVAAAACMSVLAWRPMLPTTHGVTELHMIDVGQGDAIALRSARGRWVLFDAGRDWRGGDEGQRDVVPYIARRGGALLAFILSHPHADHVGGATSTLRALRPTVYIDPGYAGATTSYLASLQEARRSRIRWSRVHPGDSLVVDEVVITFLAPDSTWASSQRDPNLASTVARVRVGNVTILLTGDAEAPEERWLLARDAGSLRADVLKVGHHGSSTSSTDAFLAAVQPRLALVSVGAGNLYGHPNRAVLRSLAAHGAVTLRTDLDGSIVVRTDGRGIEVEAAGERWTLAK
ncbi:MAG TPA: DNA internalization-related competence protein ComEC/Rec2 [Gemmatimonadaceae bacterium]|nr:DNA internalization-related competence protein ComEC/Rec2 [Gemmatimonadaceae bacterium]